MQVKWKHIIREIRATSDGYLVAVSGGVDSVFMLHFVKKHFPGDIRVAHFNHHLRSESDVEEQFVRDLCASLSVPCVVGHGDPAAMRADRSVEAGARDQRYRFLSSVLPPNSMIMLGHHANDQLETIILRAMRGYPHSNLRMLKQDGNRYRPFLDVPKEVIATQAKHRGLQWHEDPSNSNLDFERNWVRHTLIPEMNTRRNVLRSMVFTSQESSTSPFGDDDFN